MLSPLKTNAGVYYSGKRLLCMVILALTISNANSQEARQRPKTIEEAKGRNGWNPTLSPTNSITFHEVELGSDITTFMQRFYPHHKGDPLKVLGKSSYAKKKQAFKVLCPEPLLIDGKKTYLEVTFDFFHRDVIASTAIQFNIPSGTETEIEIFFNKLGLRSIAKIDDAEPNTRGLSTYVIHDYSKRVFRIHSDQALRKYGKEAPPEPPKPDVSGLEKAIKVK